MTAEHLGDAVATRRVLVVDLESPEDVVYQRARGFGLRGAVEGFAYLHRPPGFDLLAADGLARLRATIVEHSAELVVIDSLRRAAPGLDENDSRQVSILLSALRTLAAELKATILVVHHPRKPVGDARVEALYAARGSGDLIGSADSAIFFRKLSGGLVRVEHAKARRGREHEHVHFRVVADEETGAPVLEHVEPEDAIGAGDYEQRVLDYLAEHPWTTTDDLQTEPTGRAAELRKARQRLEKAGRLERAPSPTLGLPGKAMRWNLAPQAESNPVPTRGIPQDADDSPGATSEATPSPVPPFIGDGVAGPPSPLEALADDLPANEAAIVRDLADMLDARLVESDQAGLFTVPADLASVEASYFADAATVEATAT